MTGKKIFYGWYIVGGAMVAFFVASTLSMFAASIMVKPMIAEMGWSRSDFFAVQFLATLIGGVAAPFVGRRIDVGNPRLLVLAGGLIVGASVMSYSLVHSLWLYLLLAGVVTAAGISLCGMPVFNALIGKWFVRKRGRALITAGVGMNVAGIAMPPVVVALLAGLGWRMTWVAIGAGILALMIPVSLFVRGSPEDTGLQPDGEALPTMADPRHLKKQEPEWRWRQLRSTGAFWLIAVLMGLVMMAAAGSGLHLYPFLTDRSVSPGMAAAMISSASVAALVTRPMWSHVFERWDPRNTSLLAFLTLALSIIILPLSTNVAVLFLSNIVRGVSMGGGPALAPLLCGHYFGRRSLGEVLGISQLISLAFAASGPFVAAWTFDVLHSYTLVFSVFAAFGVVCSILVFLIRAPVPKTEAGPTEGQVRS